MTRRSGCIAFMLLVGASAAHAQLTINVTVPAATPDSASVYIAGTFNLWNPGDPLHRLRRDPAGQHTITLRDSVRGPIEFKFTLGSWERVETDTAGGDVANRKLTVPDTGAVTHAAAVAGWKSGMGAAPRPHSATPSVSVLAADFALPQLGRTRRIWLYLPPDYATSGRRYPVLYMHDGQNVFDDATSYAGEWGVDETIDSLHARGARTAIIVAVDHGGERRIDEYSPWRHVRYGGGEGAAYVEFIVKTMKPYMDAHYRTLADRSNTAIAGSSMGGLISLYAALKHPDVFGSAAVFSPALWIAPEVLDFARTATLPARPRLYFVSAGDESNRPEQAAVYAPLLDALKAKGYADDLLSLIRADGAHSEWFWRREFAAAFEWLFR